MSEHVDRSLGLLQDDISQERLVLAFVRRSHVHEDHFVRDGTETVDPDLYRPAGFSSQNVLIGQLKLDRFGAFEFSSLSFHAMGRISAPAPVSTSIPHRMNLSSSNRLVTFVCTMIRPIRCLLPARIVSRPGLAQCWRNDAQRAAPASFGDETRDRPGAASDPESHRR